MILFRYLAKEVGTTLIALTSILILIFMSNQVMIYLNRAASGIIPGMLVLKLMMLELPNLLSLLLPLGFYFSLLLAYGRLYADSEMVVLQACGYSSSTLLKHTVVIAIIVAIFTAGMISLSPTIAYQRAKLLQTTGVQTLIKTIIPGRFRSIMNDRYVFYVESMNSKHTKANHIFVARQVKHSGKKSWDVLTAKSGMAVHDKNSGEEYLTFEDGKHYQGEPGKADYQIATFSRYDVRLPHQKTMFKPDIRTVPFQQLLPFNNPDHVKAAELQWRISIPLMVLTLTIVGVPLSRVNPRAGKYAKLLPGVILAVLYANFMFITRDWIAAGTVPPWLGMWWLHGLMVLIGLGLIWRQRGSRS
ncbi:MAG: LPS export ABC transporter permease LptF [Gammaproteobacteria bacterium]|nr:LPS export ABC transporter permease LptF [Gammaproteobacteria bacterium]